jgi:hypothetical protein
MILTIVLILSFLVALNFFLLFFSCNKTTKTIDNHKAVNLNKVKRSIATNQLPSHQLAPTGS